MPCACYGYAGANEDVRHTYFSRTPTPEPAGGHPQRKLEIIFVEMATVVPLTPGGAGVAGFSMRSPQLPNGEHYGTEGR